MIFTKIYLHNLGSFHQATLDLTIQREVKTSTVPFEYLEPCPKFRFRRVCILSGANASGKTALGNILWRVQQFLTAPGLEGLNDLRRFHYNKSRAAVLSVEFVTLQEPRLHNLEVTFTAGGGLDAQLRSVPIGKTHSAGKARHRLHHMAELKVRGATRCAVSVPDGAPFSPNHVAFFGCVANAVSIYPAWHYMMSSNAKLQSEHFQRVAVNEKILSALLMSFDTSVAAVQPSHDDDGHNGYTLKFGNSDTVLIDNEGRPTNPDRLSRGTFDAIDVSAFVSSLGYVSGNDSLQTGTFYLDEKMASAHSELEQAVLNLIIDRLGRHAQLFYTTHNYDILDLNLPVHSFAFIRKNRGEATFVQPETLFNKNDRGLLNYVRNDVFCTLPDTSPIDALLLEEASQDA